ncbi:hypothetical protein, partial [Chromobacterium phragmitis]|uniref:hypothetical protein n=1 Tax=Chromobacterium phragmitis TaxID=2202141 RepID=UPI003267148A
EDALRQRWQGYEACDGYRLLRVLRAMVRPRPLPGRSPSGAGPLQKGSKSEGELKTYIRNGRKFSPPARQIPRPPRGNEALKS